MAVLPSAESATAPPCWAPQHHVVVPTSLLPCWVHTAPLRVNTQAPPALLSSVPPISAVLPSADNATAAPKNTRPKNGTVFAPVSLPPCCVQVPALRVNTQ